MDQLEIDAREILERITDGFFSVDTQWNFTYITTKQKGTGLGMMTSFKFIESHAGKMEIGSKEGEGTIVKIYLPVHYTE